MDVHKNARLAPAGREATVRCAVEQRRGPGPRPVVRAATAAARETREQGARWSPLIVKTGPSA